MTTPMLRIQIAAIGILVWLLSGCSIPALVSKIENKKVPERYLQARTDTTNLADINWRIFFADSNLVALIDTGLINNQELNIILQDINIANNEIKARKGRYLPYVDVGIGISLEKAGRYTRNGAVDENVNIDGNRRIPANLTNFMLGATMSWQVDIWKQLRNAKQVAVLQYLASIEGKNFMVTNLVAEIATAYYELMAFDNQLEILKKNIEVQINALKVIKLQKMAGNVTELAVKRFEAEVLKNQSHQYLIEQQIIQMQNRINFLIGRYPQPINRSSSNFNKLNPDSLYAGLPSQLLANRPDIRQAEKQLAASKLDIEIARRNFYPTLRISASLGYEAFNPRFLLSTPESMLYSFAGGLVGPLLNRNEIKATLFSANARQIQAAFQYEQTLLRAYTEVSNQLANVSNLAGSYARKEEQVQALNRSVDIVINLFNSARADYVEILLTQRDAFEARIDLVEIKMNQMHAYVDLYRALGGGWK